MPVTDREAAEHLGVIRTLMERAALYRRALAPVALTAGALGLLAAAVGAQTGAGTPAAFATLWLATALLAGGTGLGIIRRQAVRDGEPLLSPPVRRIAHAVLPGFLLGALAGVVTAVAGGRDVLPGVSFQLAVLWLGAYGLAVHAAGAFMPRHVRWLAWAFLLLSLGGWLLWAFQALLPPGLVDRLCHRPGGPHGLMGLAFGGLHLAYGLALTATERRPAP